MKPAPFDYHAPRTLDEALTLLAQYGSDAKPLAGGQSLIPAMNFRLATPAVLVDLNGIAELSYVVADHAGASVRIGAMTRHRELERNPSIARYAPLVTRTMPYVAHAAIRTRGTIGGSLAHADPAAELPAVALALDAVCTVTSSNGTRAVPAHDFFVGLFTTALAPGEILTEIAVPMPQPRTGVAFREFSRRHGDFALAGVAAAVTIDEAGRCSGAHIALLAVGDRPLLATNAAAAMVGQFPSTEALKAAAGIAAADDIDPPSDIHASSRYRRQLVNVLTRRTLEEAFGAVPR